MQQERTIEQRIKDIDAQLDFFGMAREKAAQWGDFLHVSEEEYNLSRARENLVEELHRSKAP